MSQKQKSKSSMVEWCSLVFSLKYHSLFMLKLQDEKTLTGREGFMYYPIDPIMSNLIN